MPLIFHVYLISFLNNLPIVFNMIHDRVQFSTSALSVGRKNSIHVLFSPNVAWHWSSWPSGRRGGSRYILHWRCSQPEGDKVQYRILHEPGEWTGESWHSHTLHQGKILISRGFTDGSVGWVSFNHAGGRGFGLKLRRTHTLFARSRAWHGVPSDVIGPHSICCLCEIANGLIAAASGACICRGPFSCHRLITRNKFIWIC